MELSTDANPNKPMDYDYAYRLNGLAYGFVQLFMAIESEVSKILDHELEKPTDVQNKAVTDPLFVICSYIREAKLQSAEWQDEMTEEGYVLASKPTC